MKNLINKTGTLEPIFGNDVPVLVIFAPTASGKTALMESLFAEGGPLAHRGQIISADSMQVYKGMDIGTAKPDKNLLTRIPHKMIDMCSPKEQFGAGKFVKNADAFCKQIWSEKKLPVVCGGTAFYIRNFVYGLPPTPSVDETLRANIAKRMEKEGAQKLWNELKLKDPESASKINVHDEYRIKRALEIIYETGHPRSFFTNPQKQRKGFKFLIIELQRPREELYARINTRVDFLFEQGLEQEVENLIKNGCSKDDPGMQAIGYREFFMVDKNLSKEDQLIWIKEAIKKNTRRYAKRQITFFKPLRDVVRIDAKDEQTILKCILDDFPFLKTSTLDHL